MSDRLVEIASREAECVLVCGDAFLGVGFDLQDRPRSAGLRIPALTVIHRERQPTNYVRHSLEIWNRELGLGCAPSDLVLVGAIGVDCLSLRDLLGDRAEWISIPRLLAMSIRRAELAGSASVELFAADCVVSAGIEALQNLGGPRLARGLTLELCKARQDG